MSFKNRNGLAGCIFPRKLRTIRVPVVAALLGIAFVLGQLSINAGVGLLETSDSPVFVGMARDHAVASEGFLAGPRPPLTSLLLKLAGQSPRKFAAWQWTIHIVAWASLAGLLLWRTRPLAAGAGLAVAVLALALMPQVQVWNLYLMSESVSLSMIPLVFGCLAVLAERPGLRGELPLIAILAIGGGVRDLHAYLALSLATAVFVGFAVLSRWRRRPWLVLVAGFAVFAASDISADHGYPDSINRRWVFPLVNVIGQRVLTDPAACSYFEASGMPMSPALHDRAGKWASSDGFAAYHDPELADFRAWLVAHGKSTYMRWLLEHPGPALGAVWAARGELLHLVPEKLAVYYPGGYPEPELHRRLAEDSVKLGLASLALALPIAAWRRRRGFLVDDGIRLGLAVASFAPVPVLMFVAYHGDAMDLARHSLGIAVYFRVWLVFVAWLLLQGTVAPTIDRRPAP